MKNFFNCRLWQLGISTKLYFLSPIKYSYCEVVTRFCFKFQPSKILPLPSYVGNFYAVSFAWRIFFFPRPNTRIYFVDNLGVYFWGLFLDETLCGVSFSNSLLFCLFAKAEHVKTGAGKNTSTWKVKSKWQTRKLDIGKWWKYARILYNEKIVILVYSIEHTSNVQLSS